MRKIVYLTSVLICLFLLTTCTSIPNEGSQAKNIEISVVTYMIGGAVLSVKVPPPDYVIPDRIYPVDLFEKNKLRARAKITWTQAEINVDHKKEIRFPLTTNEQTVYRGKDLSNIFSIQIGNLPLE